MQCRQSSGGDKGSEELARKIQYKGGMKRDDSIHFYPNPLQEEKIDKEQTNVLSCPAEVFGKRPQGYGRKIQYKGGTKRND